jgi:hypothetical protein
MCSVIFWCVAGGLQKVRDVAEPFSRGIAWEGGKAGRGITPRAPLTALSTPSQERFCGVQLPLEPCHVCTVHRLCGPSFELTNQPRQYKNEHMKRRETWKKEEKKKRRKRE